RPQGHQGRSPYSASRRYRLARRAPRQMTSPGKLNRPPSGKAWIWFTDELVTSDAWRSLGINARRFIDFLMHEHMGKAGGENGNLKAPHGHLAGFGIAACYAPAAIREAEEHGLVEAQRGGMRVATTYALTWLPLHDGTPPSNRWQAFRDPNLPASPGSK